MTAIPGAMARMAFMVFACATLPVLGDIVRIPCRYTESSSIVNECTGTASDKRAKMRLCTIGLETKKLVADGAVQLTLKTKPGTSERNKASIVELAIPFMKCGELLSALDRGYRRLSACYSNREESIDSLFECDGLKLTLVLGKKSHIELALKNEAIFELQQQHVQQLVDAVKRQ